MFCFLLCCRYQELISGEFEKYIDNHPEVRQILDPLVVVFHNPGGLGMPQGYAGAIASYPPGGSPHPALPAGLNGADHVFMFPSGVSEHQQVQHFVGYMQVSAWVVGVVCACGGVCGCTCSLWFRLQIHTYKPVRLWHWLPTGAAPVCGRRHRFILEASCGMAQIRLHQPHRQQQNCRPVIFLCHSFRLSHKPTCFALQRAFPGLRSWVIPSNSTIIYY